MESADEHYGGSLEGTTVEIVGLGAQPVPRAFKDIEGYEPSSFQVDGIDGCKGLCVQWYEPDSLYCVQLLNGLVVCVREEYLKVYVAPPPQMGGFDVIWPLDPELLSAHGEIVCDVLAQKEFCVLHMSVEQSDQEMLMKELKTELDYHRLPVELESAYLGLQSSSKIAPIKPADADFVSNDVLHALDQDLTAIGGAVMPFTESMLGFRTPECIRSESMVRTNIDEQDLDSLVPEVLTEMNTAEQSNYLVDYVDFYQKRMLCMIYVVHGQGGNLWLYPRKKPDKGHIDIPISSGKVIVFRHDVLDYSYQPIGDNMAMQSWILRDDFKKGPVNEMQVSLDGQAGEVLCNPGPPVPDKPKANVNGFHTRLPGACWSPEEFWASLAYANDGIIHWPRTRFETEPYYEANTQSAQTGKSYTCHGGFISEDQFEQFDNNFFGIPEAEAKTMVPGQRIALEVGYTALRKSGFNKSSLKGQEMGTWFGDVGPDWHRFQATWAEWHRAENDDATILATSTSCSGTAGRISYLFDLRGPISSYDTACSSSLVAMNAAHLMMFDSDEPRKETSQALVVGINTFLGPGFFIGCCMATMLSHQGRSFTFDRSADGYQRGEGCGAVYLKLSQGTREEELRRIAAIIGTATNQDGRSASLTAPNGPAQQKVVTKSMRFAGIDPNTVSIAECHGTGTALGDPIEVGALMAVMYKREFPILKTSAKSALGHLEAGAAIAGLSKCILMIMTATAVPNCHLKTINAHLVIQDYPVYFDSETIDTGFSSLFCGVSSFGFGGTNSRADVYGYAQSGPRKTVSVELPRVNPALVLPSGQSVYISGSWNAWTSHDEMDMSEDGSTYQCQVVIGETGVERFQLSLTADGSGSQVFHPLTKNASSCTQIVGPDSQGYGLNFAINGLSDGYLPGAAYRITFKWHYEQKTIMWDVLSDPVGNVLGLDFQHKYYIIGTWSDYKFQDMVATEDPSVYEYSFTIGYRQKERFQIARDRDATQLYYPSHKGEAEPSGGAAQGPDDPGSAKSWKVLGQPLDKILVRFTIRNGEASVETMNLSSRGGEIISPPSEKPPAEDTGDSWILDTSHFSYYVVGTLTNDRPLPLTLSYGGVYRCQVELTGWKRSKLTKKFQIATDTDVTQVLYPDEKGRIAGPDAGVSRSWSLSGPRGAVFEIRLNVATRKRDDVVTWEMLKEPDEFS